MLVGKYSRRHVPDFFLTPNSLAISSRIKFKVSNLPVTRKITSSRWNFADRFRQICGFPDSYDK